MRHRKEKRPLGRTSSHRDAMLRNLVTSLIDTGRITTTLPKAKELRRVADRMITLGKRGDLAARRLALRTIRSAAVVKKLFTEVALRSESRPGGYTRILHLGTRPGDGASMAIIELVDRPKPVAEEGHGKKGAPKSKGTAAPKAPRVPKEKTETRKAPKQQGPAGQKAAPRGRGAKKAPGAEG